MNANKDGLALIGDTKSTIEEPGTAPVVSIIPLWKIQVTTNIPKTGKAINKFFFFNNKKIKNTANMQTAIIIGATISDGVASKSFLSHFTKIRLTANRTNVENVVYDSEGFTVCYYAVKEYHIAADGTETLFQTRSHIKIK